MRYFHRNLCLLGRSLKFPVPEGLCRGLTMVWLEEALSDQGRGNFQRLMNFIASASPENSLKKIQSAQLKQEQRLLLTAEEQLAFEIPSFFKRVMHYQLPSHYYPQILSQDNIQAISTESASESLRAQGGFRVVYSQPGIYSFLELHEYFQALEKTLRHSSAPPLTELLLSGEFHSIGLTYDPINQWRGMDSNQYHPKQSKVNPADFTNQAFRIIQRQPFYSPYISMNTFLLLPQNTASKTPDFISRLNLFRQERVNLQITKQTASRVSRFNGHSLTHLGAYFGHIDVLDRTARLGSNLDQPLKNTKTPAFLAAQQGQIAVIDCLKKYGADMNLPATFSPVSLWEWARLFHDHRILKRTNYFIQENKPQNPETNQISCRPIDIAGILDYQDIIKKLDSSRISDHGFFSKKERVLPAESQEDHPKQSVVS